MTHNILFLVFIMQIFSPLFAHAMQKPQHHYRIYDETSPEHVKEFYRSNHTFQTLDFVLKKREQYLSLNRQKMGIWEAMEVFDTLIDESDGDLNLPQRYHLFQTAESLRKSGQPRWLILTGLIHDLGKILAFYEEPQWAVVGDTFPVGCAYSGKIVFPEYFENNSDILNPLYQTKLGIYSPGCGLDHVLMSWGHDEYLYHVVKDYLPKQAAFIIRYHSFYAAHLEGAYEYLMNEEDQEMLPWLQLFSAHDLYSKTDEPLDIQALLPYYQELVAEFFPSKLKW